MHVLLVYAHPEPRSFSRAMRELAVATLTAAGHEVVVSDLYADGFDPVAGPGDFTDRVNPEVLDFGIEQAHAARTRSFAPALQREVDRLLAADCLLLQFPFWWFSAPAILKGWIDRVFAYGVAHEFGRTWERGAFRDRRAMLAFTTSTPPASTLPDGRSGDLERTLWPLHAGTLALCGYDVLPPFVAPAVRYVDDARRQELLAAWRERLLSLTTTKPLFFHPDEDFGPDRRLKPGVEPVTPGQHRGRRFHLD